MAKKIEVEILGDSSSYQRALGQAQSKTSKFGALAKTALIGGVAAGLYAVGKAAKMGWDEFNEGQAVAAQTQAVLKSTGGVANVTAKEVEGLADALHLKTTFDDEAIQSGENMLLTFRNIRDEAGKGNDIFTQATKVTLDFAQAMGMDAKSAALQVGKALNNPLTGMTKLQRQGVEFSDKQKTLITRLVESGKTMKAQKVILKELTKEFGGSAKAAGDTFGGQLTILRNRLDDFLGLVVEKAIPYLQRFIKWVGPYAHDALVNAKAAIEGARKAWAQLGDTLAKHQETVDKVVKVLRILGKVLGWLIDWEILLYGTIWKIWIKILEVVLTVTDKLIAAAIKAKDGITAAYDKVKPVIDRLKGWFNTAKDVAQTAFGAIKGYILDLVGPLITVIGYVKDAIGWFRNLFNASHLGAGLGAAAGAGVGGPSGKTPPELARGGHVARSGLAVIHRGETVVPAMAGWGSGDIVLQVDGRELLRASRRAESRESRR